MEHQATLTFSEPLIRRAVVAFWRRTIGVGFFVALAILIVSLTYMVRAGDRSWVVGVLASVLAMGVGFPVLFFVAHYRNSMAKLRAMGSPTASLIA